MFDVHPRVSGVASALLAQYRSIATSTLGHFTDFGAIAGLEPVCRPVRLLGRALTVRIPHLDGSVIRQALEVAEPGDVLVIEVSGDESRACWGELRSYAALRKGLAGVVTSGRVTDTAELARLNLPIFSRGASPLTTRAMQLEDEVNIPVAIAGVAIAPGDLIVGDDDGLFILSPTRAEALLAPALNKQAQEASRRQEFRAAHPEWWR
ncbi:RraA family protein [Halomonas sp. MCCC 1A11036]|uniref:Putative 4-hydroxy-4-methyl-2-oxoglutarate aldolase n=1 Tax=Billgrantia zhangzhouensis TaxID=2733481 RepID=A0ABS9AE80_9GAMM|nr:RraA family protein [Halomonas zhangzhouensis]MCE8020031.1 RraA family protein [Halomonas zhangzhouensis]